MGLLNLAWRDAMLFAGREFSYAEQRAGWPPALRPMQLASLQRPYGGDYDEAGLPLNQAMLTALKDACKAGSIEHTKHAHESHEERGFPRRKGGPIAFNTFARALQNELTDTIRITPQAFLPWLAEQGEQPSEHIVAWAKANGISVPEVPKAAPVQGMAAAQGEAETAALAKVAAPVQLAIVPPAETAAERRDRRFQACLAAGLRFPDTYTNRLPDGVGRVADKEGVSRQAFSKDVREGWQRSIEARQAADELKQA